MIADQVPDWLRPPPEGWTADHLDELPPGAPRMEMIDGALIMMSPQTSFHSQVVRRLANALEDAAPADLGVETEMSVKLGERQRPEPDIVIFHVPEEGSRRTFYLPNEVILVVEVVSDESEDRDRDTKRTKYAAAGIEHYWLVEKEHERPVLHTLELDKATGAYVATAIARDRLKADVPFPIDIDLTTLVRHRPAS
ncbi:Uma2 family endonuclease [Actinomadura sp. WMMB 499]|nr:Uma2 family endonuclease [Actinomadura sp. WMMB 499]